MKVTEILMSEHENILAKLSEVDEKLNSKNWKDLAYYKHLISFLKNYADTFHHAKEESIYFIWMEEKDPMMKDGPLHCMRSEHDKSRLLVSKAFDLISNIDAKNKSNNEKESDWNLLKETILEYCQILINHIDKENNMLYRMAEHLNEVSLDGDEIMLPKFIKVNDELKEIEKTFI